MASPGELVSVLAEDLGVPAPTIAQHDRNLVLDGLRSKNGRGINAAKVTARDAAHLLVAVLASGRVKSSVHAVRRYAATALHRGDWHASGLPGMEALPDDHSFIDALEAIIDAAVAGDLSSLMTAPAVDSETNQKRVIFPDHLQVQISTTSPGTIGLFEIRSSRAISIEYRIVFPRDDTGDVDWEKVHERFGDIGSMESDLRLTSCISAKTIMGVAALLEDRTAISHEPTPQGEAA